MNILKKLNLSEVPELQVGDTILTIWDGCNLAGRQWCEREPLTVAGLPNSENVFIQLDCETHSKILLSPAAKLDFVGRNANGFNYWIVKTEEVA